MRQRPFIINCKVSAAERAEAKARAERAGLTLGEWMRTQLELRATAKIQAVEAAMRAVTEGRPIRRRAA
jgi:hypothetical protein